MAANNDPPTTVVGILGQLGPGLIIAGSIVGAGELIATTAVGAEAGFVLLWLIIIGCVIKVFVQIEFGRYAITSGRTTLEGLNEVPGPRKRVNWICWFWLVFTVVALAQLGGIIGGVGQALSIQQPLTAAGQEANVRQDAAIRLQVAESIAARFEGDETMATQLAALDKERLGAAILGRTGLDPEGEQMVRTLGQMYVPVFGAAAQEVFLFGAFAVLYSTFFVATASHARVCADALRVFGLSAGDERSRRWWVRAFCIGLPLLFLGCYAFFKAPRQLVLAGGFMGALMLPLLGVAALYFRYRRCDARLVPGRVWDTGLWLSCAGLFVAGGYAFYTNVALHFIGGSGR